MPLENVEPINSFPITVCQILMPQKWLRWLQEVISYAIHKQTLIYRKLVTSWHTRQKFLSANIWTVHFLLPFPLQRAFISGTVALRYPAGHDIYVGYCLCHLPLVILLPLSRTDQWHVIYFEGNFLVGHKEGQIANVFCYPYSCTCTGQRR